MNNQNNANAGSVLSIRRYPVKSMAGEEVDRCALTEQGLLGDRAFALIDTSDGKVVSAKNPRKWAGLLEFGAVFAEPPRPGESLPAVQITMPDGTEVLSGDENTHAALSRALGRQVRLNARERGEEGIVETTLPDPWTPHLEEFWPEDVAGSAHSGVVTDEAMPKGTFFDLATVHLLTTATLEQLQQVYGEGTFDIRRFRPNLLIQTPGEARFVENDWIGNKVQIGREVQLEITSPCPRCVMTTLPQGDLRKDTGILRAAAQHNGANVGVYASVVRGGEVRRGDCIGVF